MDTSGTKGPVVFPKSDFDEWGREIRGSARFNWQNSPRADPELAMIDMKRQHQRAKDERLPGETLHDALRRVAGIS